jgi:hypothetical protein
MKSFIIYFTILLSLFLFINAGVWTSTELEINSYNVIYGNSGKTICELYTGDGQEWAFECDTPFGAHLLNTIILAFTNDYKIYIRSESSGEKLNYNHLGSSYSKKKVYGISPRKN